MRRNQRQQQNKNTMKEKLKTNIDTSDLLIESRLVGSNCLENGVSATTRELCPECVRRISYVSSCKIAESLSDNTGHHIRLWTNR